MAGVGFCGEDFEHCRPFHEMADGTADVDLAHDNRWLGARPSARINASQLATGATKKDRSIVRRRPVACRFAETSVS